MVHPALKARRRLVFCDIILYWRTVDRVSLSDFHRRLNFSQSVKSTLPLYCLKWERLDNFSVASMPANFFHNVRELCIPWGHYSHDSCGNYLLSRRIRAAFRILRMQTCISYQLCDRNGPFQRRAE